MSQEYPFDPTYGYDLAALLRVTAPEPPEDLAAFWRATYGETLAVPPRAELREVASPWPTAQVFELEYTSLDGFRVGAWMTLPRHAPPAKLAVIGHGYGGREGPDGRSATLPVATVSPCGRGFHRSARTDYPGIAANHVLHGIAARETYSHRGCVADMWAAATVLLERFPELARTLVYAGGSFGGGIGAMAMAWEPRFVRAYLDIPSFGNHPLRVTLPCQGSGEAVRLRYLQDPSILKVLAYFDAASCARFIKVPTLVSPAVYDPAVPPPGQFAIYNAIPGEKQLEVRAAAHCEFTGKAATDAAMDEKANRFLGLLP